MPRCPDAQAAYGPFTYLYVLRLEIPDPRNFLNLSKNWAPRLRAQNLRNCYDVYHICLNLGAQAVDNFVDNFYVVDNLSPGLYDLSTDVHKLYTYTNKLSTDVDNLYTDMNKLYTDVYKLCTG